MWKDQEEMKNNERIEVAEDTENDNYIYDKLTWIHGYNSHVQGSLLMDNDACHYTYDACHHGNCWLCHVQHLWNLEINMFSLKILFTSKPQFSPSDFVNIQNVMYDIHMYVLCILCMYHCHPNLIWVQESGGGEAIIMKFKFIDYARTVKTRTGQ